MVKIISSLIFFYFLALIQTSFLVHYEIRGGSLSIVFLSIVLFNFFGEEKNKFGLLNGAIGGFCLDIFSPYFPGLFTFLGIVIAFLTNFFRSFFQTKKLISFVIVLFLVLLFYEVALSLLTLIHGFHFNVFSLIYNFLAGVTIYLLSRLIIYAFAPKRIKK